MTYIHLREHEVGAITWGYNTLRPPRITPVSLAKDLLWEMHQYRAAKLNLATSMVFLGLRILQRVAYNLGWGSG
ncbi:MAG: hypothetical protein JRN71_07150 [Nitrososphaerota archaeon]|nr:hypothetical protein [Nitrososphaerota archaeon]